MNLTPEQEKVRDQILAEVKRIGEAYCFWRPQVGDEVPLITGVTGTVTEVDGTNITISCIVPGEVVIEIAPVKPHGT